MITASDEETLREIVTSPSKHHTVQEPSFRPTSDDGVIESQLYLRVGSQADDPDHT